MSKKKFFFSILFSVTLLTYLIYSYLENQKANNDIGIIFIKSNLENYRIIPEDKGGINSPCLEILGCKKEITINE